MPVSPRHDCAVALCCDRNYFPLALFTIRQIAFLNPERHYDFVISTQDDLVLPDWAAALGTVIHKAGSLPAAAEVARYLGSMAPLLRLMLARELRDRYRRIVYLDCDMIVEGGDFNRLFQIDIGPHPIGAVLDAPFLYERAYVAREYAKVGLGALPYANTGMQLIDTAAYVEQDVEARSFAVCKDHPEAVIYTDQSLTNLALRGAFAQLAPCWNWQNTRRLPLATFRYPVFLRHFIGVTKPDRYTGKKLLEARHNQAYRDFFARFAPDRLPDLAPPPDPRPLGFGEVARIAYEHLLARPILERAFRKHADPYRAIL
jgi:lipopolysaccharide biosynthesis glycosyltransferase